MIIEKCLKLFALFFIIVPWTVCLQSNDNGDLWKFIQSTNFSDEYKKKLMNEMEGRPKWIKTVSENPSSDDQLKQCRSQIQSFKDNELRLKQNSEFITIQRELIADKASLLEIQKNETVKAHQQIDDYKDQLREKELEIKKLQTTISFHNNTINNNNVQISKLQSIIVSQKNNTFKNSAQILKLESNITNWKETVNNKYAEISKLKTNLESNNSTISKNNADISNLKSTITACKTIVNKKNETIANLESIINYFNSTIIKNNAEISKFKLTVKNNNEIFAKLESTIKSNNSTINKKNAEISRLKTTIESNNSTINKNNADISKLESTITAFKTMVNKNNETIARLESTINNNNAEISKLKSEKSNTIIKNSADISKLESNITICKESVKKKNADISRLKTTIESNNSTINKNNADISKLESTITAFKTIVNENNETIAYLKSHIHTKNLKILKLTSEKINLRATTPQPRITCPSYYNKSQQEITQLKSEANKQTNEIKELKIKLNKSQLPTSCKGLNADFQEIQLSNGNPLYVICDDDGWTIIQRRINGKLDFNKSWMEYVNGFQDTQGELFIGLENLHLLTKSSRHELYISVTFSWNSLWAKYDDFRVGNAESLYELESIGNYTGNFFDGLRANVHHKFATYDKKDFNHDCGMGGWWYPANCGYSNLNGPYNNIVWYFGVGTSAIMKIRPYG